MLSLPNDIISHLIKWCVLKDVVNLFCVCKDLRYALYASIQHVSIKNKKLSQHTWTFLTNCKSITHISFHYCLGDVEGCFVRLPAQLQSFTWVGRSCVDYIYLLKNCLELTTLHIRFYDVLNMNSYFIGDVDIMRISSIFTKLQTFNIPFHNLTDLGLCSLANIPCLRTLDLRSSPNVTSKGVQKLLPFMIDLRNIRLANMDVMNMLTIITSCSDLRTLCMCNTTLSDEGLNILCTMNNLRTLDISTNVRLTDAGFCNIKKLVNLQALDVSGCFISDIGLRYISQLPKLNELNLWLCNKITFRGIAHLHKHTSLQTLGVPYEF